HEHEREPRARALVGVGLGERERELGRLGRGGAERVPHAAGEVVESEHHAPMISATRSPRTVVGSAVVARGMAGKIEASAIRIDGMPWSRACSSTTAPW